MARPEVSGPIDCRPRPHARLRVLPVGAVRLEGGFWAPRLEANRRVSLPLAWRVFQESGTLDNLRAAAGRAKAGFRGSRWNDSDLHKWIEAACWELAVADDARLRGWVEEAIDMLVAAQQPDGYLNSYYQVAEPGAQWAGLDFSHEDLVIGHLLQAGVAHHRATGERRLLQTACRAADQMVSLFGPSGRAATGGHPAVETALVELYRETGRDEYLHLAQAWLDHRGRGVLPPCSWVYGGSSYFQDRVPVRDAEGVEGHAVRATFLATGVADLFLETGEPALLDALRRQWQDMVERKMYLTGGVGSRPISEGFGAAYELPNETACAETCAAVGTLTWAWRLLLATGEAHFADLFERVLYNTFLASVSLDGTRFAYSNPLAARGGVPRMDWHGAHCCPPNIMRFLSSLTHYLATVDAAGLQIQQFAAGVISAVIPGAGPVRLAVATAYPSDGTIEVSVVAAGDCPWTLSLRRPAWCGDLSLTVNGSPLEPAGGDGYVRITRAWRSGDRVVLALAMPPVLVEADPRIEANAGCLALQRGPLVYCCEDCDQPEGASVPRLLLDPSSRLGLRAHAGIPGGGPAIAARGRLREWPDAAAGPYRPYVGWPVHPVALTAVPYWFWGNRLPGAMRVWIPCG